MTDYDETRKRRKRNSYHNLKPGRKIATHFMQCTKCGDCRTVVTEAGESPYQIPGAIGLTGWLCENCRKSPVVFEPSPPPKALQISIEERFGTK